MPRPAATVEQRLRVLSAHVASAGAGAQHQQLSSMAQQHGPVAAGQSKHLTDNYANSWSVGPGGRLCATAPGRSHELVTTLSEHGSVDDFAVDDNGCELNAQAKSDTT